MTSENDMTDEELEEFEQATRVVEDKYDRLDDLRRLLNSSKIEMMHGLKRGTKLGPLCPYYLKAKRLFIENEKKKIVSDLKSLLAELEASDD